MNLLLVLGLVLSFADSVQIHYGEKDADGLRRLCEETSSREADLLCRYRLYPLTRDEDLVQEVPDHLEGATPRELALLAGLWGYRAARAPLHRAIRYGFHSDRLLKQAKASDPDEPYVLLVEGQSLLFRPALAGGDASEALRRFSLLQRVLRRKPGSGISSIESELWIWYALKRTRPEEATAMRARLLRSEPPRLYEEFLNGA